MSSCEVVFCSFEAHPFAKVGGLADVAGALPDALAEVGVNCKLIMPRFAQIDAAKFDLEPVEIPNDWYVSIRNERYPFQCWKTKTAKGAEVYFLGDEHFFGRPGIYADADGKAFPQELDRYVFFAKGCLELVKCLGWRPDVIHSNDYQTGAIAAWVRRTYADEQAFARTRLVYSIHNLAYQGVYEAEAMASMGFGSDEFEPMGPFEFHGAVNLMKIGINFADAVNTVSPSYAREILTEAHGAGLEGVLQAASHKLSGILNGIDTAVWNPETDPLVGSTYSLDDLSGKKEAKRALMAECDLDPSKIDRPLVGMIGRLVEQKGGDLVLPLVDDIIGHDVSLVLLGSGAADLEQGWKDAAARHPGRLHAKIGFDEGLAHRITAGADIFLMPSRYEPCGLNQMYAMRYGTIPVVHRTGGLADTVEEWNGEAKSGTGFLFDEPREDLLASALGRAFEVFDQGENWTRLQNNAMSKDFSWTRSAREYQQLYLG
ncbi:MAG: glycogen synthase GlgA [Planctomycetota bacterium]